MPQYITYMPHPGQQKIHDARGKRFRTVCTGRRFGKTYCLAGELLDWGGCIRGGDYGWVAPTYNVAERGIEAFRAVSDGFIQICGRAPCRVEFQGVQGIAPTRVWFLSADNPDSIRGFGFQGLVIDEAASIPRDVWHYVLRPTIAQTLGWAVFVSTPKGRNWFYDMHTRGLDPTETEYASFTFPSNASPYFPQREWDEAKRTLPEDVFRQEYMAEFMEDSAGVFRGVDACLYDPGLNGELGMRNAECARQVVIGCDVAKHTDWTVLIAMDAESGKCFAMERFNQLDWPIQKERIVGFARRWRGRVILDATGVGDPIYDDLKGVLPNIEGFKLTQSSKTQLVQRLIVAVEQRQVCWPSTSRRLDGRTVGQSGSTSDRIDGIGRIGERPDCPTAGPSDWGILTAEMKRFEYEIGPSGGVSYGAPSGYHDDCVMALALANHGRWETGNCGHMFTLSGPSRRMRRGPRVVYE